jgi:transcriptional regulator of acetoin/glycerol metabolism
LTDGADADLVVPVPDALSGCLQDMEIQAIKSALARVNGNVSAAARLLGVSRNTIYRKIPELAQRPQ